MAPYVPYLPPSILERVKEMAERYEAKPNHIIHGLQTGHSLDEMEEFYIIDDLLFKRGWTLDEIRMFRDRAYDMAYLYGKKYIDLLREADLRTFEQATEKLDEIEAHLSEEAEAHIKEAPVVGKHRGVENGRFDRSELLKGIRVEMEHTDDPAIAKEIAKDHLAEIPDYYTRLARMEREAGVVMNAPRNQTPEEKRLREIVSGRRSFEPEDLALFGLGAGLATILPSPADILYFYIERWLDEHRYEITPTRYWVIRAFNYYITDSSWHWLLLAWILISKRPVKEKTELYFSMVSAGAVAAVLFDFIREEEKKRTEAVQKPGQTVMKAPGESYTKLIWYPKGAMKKVLWKYLEEHPELHNRTISFDEVHRGMAVDIFKEIASSQGLAEAVYKRFGIKFKELEYRTAPVKSGPTTGPYGGGTPSTKIPPMGPGYTGDIATMQLPIVHPILSPRMYGEIDDCVRTCNRMHRDMGVVEELQDCYRRCGLLR